MCAHVAHNRLRPDLRLRRSSVLESEAWQIRDEQSQAEQLLWNFLWNCGLLHLLLALLHLQDLFL